MLLRYLHMRCFLVVIIFSHTNFHFLICSRKTARCRKNADSYGLIQYSFAYLMDSIAKKQDASFSIRASYLEIYNEQVCSLFIDLNKFGYFYVYFIVQYNTSRRCD